MPDETQRLKAFGKQLGRLVDLMAHLRSPQGCPWDREQTLHSLRAFILEEAYELVDAIESGRSKAVREETGDLLLEVLFVCQIASEQAAFQIGDVMSGLEEKIVRRHPHVFGSRAANSADEAIAHWDSIKDAEKDSEPRSILKEVPRTLPAMGRASKLSTRAAQVGFDWQSVDEIVDKLQEELRELDAARNSADKDSIAEEVGDLLFVIVNLARHLKVDPEMALRAANRKFETRFRHIERTFERRGRPLSEATLEEMEALWQEAKLRPETPVNERSRKSRR